MNHTNPDQLLEAPDFNEDVLSKLPALQLLSNMGYRYLTSKEANRMRNNKSSQVILEGILIPWLRENNIIRFKNETHPFSENNIIGAVDALKSISASESKDGLMRTNEKIYDLLCLGKSQPQAIDGNTKSFHLKYIDWEEPYNNVFHVCEEFSVECSGSKNHRRPDIVLFVNGIPLVVIENKAPGKDAMEKAIAQHLGNHKREAIPHLFHYSQVLMTLSGSEAKYGTTKTKEKFWSIWREDKSFGFDTPLPQMINKPLESHVEAEILSYPSRDVTKKNGLISQGDKSRMQTVQDELIYAILMPPRLLELIFGYILYDEGIKKIARYQQYFAVRKTISRIQALDEDFRRQGGLVWHTQGSGKSLTMVFLGKAISLCNLIPDYRILLVTDRVNLDDQIYKTFQNCGKDVAKAKSGRDLAGLLASPQRRIITTVIDKFETAIKKVPFRDTNPNIFVLVDEGHRGQHGPLHTNMKRVLRNACYIGFTGTPVMKKDRDTINKFGGLIDSYTIEQAVEDKAVVPLLYEGRHVNQLVDKESIDTFFDHITSPLRPRAIQQLKRSYSTTDQLNKTERKVMTIAFDINNHYVKNWQKKKNNGIGFKAQLVTQDKATALRYKYWLDQFGEVSSQVLISGPQSPENENDEHLENKEKVTVFWEEMMDRYGSEKSYNKQVIEAFKYSPNPEIIIVVDKLLTGFDAPLNTVLYLTRVLKDHTLLQAIARVNRLCEGKDFGFIIDYRGVLANLDNALDIYRNLRAYDYGDLKRTLKDIGLEIELLPAKHNAVWDIFKEVENKQDVQEMQMALADEALRVRFYDRLSSFARAFGIAMSSLRFIDDTSERQVDIYKKNLAFFMKLRTQVRFQYSDAVNFKEYEPRIRKLLDTHVGTEKLEEITPQFNIFDRDAFAHAVAQMPGTASRADAIAHQVQRTIRDRMEQDPAFYKKFSKMLEEAIQAFRANRLRDMEYLNRVKSVHEAIVNRTDEDVPEKLKNKDTAIAYFGVIKETLGNYSNQKGDAGTGLDDLSVHFSLGIEEIIEKLRIINWDTNNDIKNQMRTQIEDFICNMKDRENLDIDFDTIDIIMEQCIEIAQVRRP